MPLPPPVTITVCPWNRSALKIESKATATLLLFELIGDVLRHGNGNFQQLLGEVFALRVDAQAGDTAAAQGVFQQKIQAVAAGQVPAFNAAVEGVEHVAHPVDDHLRGQRFGDPRQVVGVAGDHADIAVVALVAGARHGQLYQRHIGVGAALGLGRVNRRGRGDQWRRGGQFNSVTLALKVDHQLAGGSIDQERKQPNQRIHRRPPANDAGQAGRHASGRLGDLAGEQHQRLFARVPYRQFHHHFAAILTLGVGAVGGFAAEQFDIHLGIRRPAALAEQFRSLVDDRLADALGLGHRVDPGDQATGGATKTVRVGGADLVLIGGRQTFGAVQAHLVFALLLQFDLAEIADHIGQQVGARVADFIQQLFGHTEFADQPARTVDFIDGELAVGTDLYDGKTNVLVVRHVTPIGEVATGALCAAFDDVPGEGGLGEAVIVLP